VRVGCQVLGSRASRAGVVLVAAAAVIVAGAVPAAGALRPPRDEFVRATLYSEGLALDSTEGLLESAAAGSEGAGAGLSAAAMEEKNPLVAMLMSVALPGWGELYTGNTARAKGFLTAEAAIWLGYATFTIQEDMRTDDYHEFAQIFADVPEGASSEYYQDIADYVRSEGTDSYNEAVRAEARSLYPDDLEAQRAYLTANGYFGSSSWEWESEARFEHYRDLRHIAGVSRKNAFYMTGLAVLNRALSAVDSAWMARRHNQGLSDDRAMRMSLIPEVAEDSVGGRLAVEFPF